MWLGFIRLICNLDFEQIGLSVRPSDRLSGRAEGRKCYICHLHLFNSHSQWHESNFDLLKVSCFMFHVSCLMLMLNKIKFLHYGSEQPRIGTKGLGYSLILCSFACSLVRLFTCITHSFACSTLLALLTRSIALIYLLACSLTLSQTCGKIND